MSQAGGVPAARFRARRGRHRPDRARTSASGRPRPDAVDPARITVIRPAGELRLVVLEDGRRFRVDAERMARLGLEAGFLLEAPVLALLERDEAYRRARDSALRLLAIRPRSTAELLERLHRAGVPVGPAGSAIADLTTAGYLDDLEFARAWVRGRLAIRPCGVLRLRVELRERGVANALIEQAIREVHGEEDAAAAEERRAHELAERRLRASARLAWDARIRRLASLLQRRGFAAHTIARVLRTVERRNRIGTTDA